MLYWLWSFVPWWLIVIVAVVVIGFGWQFIAPIWALLPKPVKWFLGFLASIAIAIQYGRNKGEKAAQEKRAQDNANAIKTRDNIDAKVQALPDTAVVDQLDRNKWLRD